jgi:hypothetical protein
MTKFCFFLNGNFFAVHFFKATPESIYCNIEYEAFMPSYDFASPSPPPSPVSKLSLILSLPVCRRSSSLTGERAGGGGAKSYDDEKIWYSMIHSILSATNTHFV